MKKSTKGIALLLSALFAASALTGCTNTDTPKKTSTDAPQTEQVQASPTPATDTNINTDTNAIHLAAGSGFNASGEVDPAYIGVNNGFAVKLVNAMGENWTGVVSPLSFNLALQMLANGADESVQAQIIDALSAIDENNNPISAPIGDINANAARLIALLTAEKENAEETDSIFTLNNAILVSNRERFNAEFEKALADSFKASVGSIDFTDTKAALDAINGWVKENTNGLIPELLSDISSDTVTALINALYFKGTWKTPFKAFSDPMVFHGASGDTEIRMLNMTDQLAYGEIGDNQITLLPYQDGKFYMALVLPKEGSSPAAALGEVASSLGDIEETATVTVSMPALELNTNIDAMAILDKLGLGGISDGSRQFSKLIENGDITVSQFVHAAVLKVDEAGTEAAAATGITGQKFAAPIGESYSMICDRPYALAIVHAESGAIVFASTVNDVPSVNNIK